MSYYYASSIEEIGWGKINDNLINIVFEENILWFVMIIGHKVIWNRESGRMVWSNPFRRWENWSKSIKNYVFYFLFLFLLYIF